MYLRSYLFIFLNDRFVFFGVQKVNYVVISSVLLGSAIFGLFLCNVNRRILNFLISSGTLGLSSIVLGLSFFAGRDTLDSFGLVAACKIQANGLTLSLRHHFGELRLLVLVPVQLRIVSFAGSTLHDGVGDSGLQLGELAAPFYGDLF